MSNVKLLFPEHKHSEEAIQEQACLWVSKMDRGLTDKEQQEFISWTETSCFHRESVFKFASLWDDLSVLHELSALFPLEKHKTSHRLTKHFAKYALAASFIITVLFTGSIFLDQHLNSRQIQQQYVEIKNLSTVVGQHGSFSLSDGSIIQLNTNSLVKINFSQSKRSLTLVRGEARFEVAKDKNRPFTVISGDKSFTALGTIFNVQKSSSRDMELVVTEGRVLITKGNNLGDDIAKQIYSLPAKQLPGVLVVAGEKAIIEKDIAAPVQHISLDQMQKDLAWQQGMLIFTGDPLLQALQEVSRYTATNFEVTDNKLAQIKVAGYFKAGDIDGLLQSLSSNFNIHYEKTTHNSIRLSSIPSKALEHLEHLAI